MLSTPIGVTLAGMLILKCEVTGEPVSGSFIFARDAEAAPGSSEFLAVVDDSFGDFYGYGPPLSNTVPRRQLPDQGWIRAYSIKLQILERLIHAAWRDPTTSA